MRILNSTLLLSIALSIASCSSNKSSDYEETSADSISTNHTVADLPGQEAKLVKTASIDFKVKDVYKSSKSISDAARAVGGLVIHHDISSTLDNDKKIAVSEDSVQVVSSYYTRADMSVKVPSQLLEEFMQQVSGQAIFIHKSNLDIDDRSLDYLSQALKQQTRQKSIDMQTAKSTLKTTDALNLANQQDQVIDQKINNLRTDASVKYSTIQLSFYQNQFIKKEIIANNDLDTYKTPFYKRLNNALWIGFSAFGDCIVAITHLWAFILMAILGWLAYKYYKSRIKIA